MAVRHLSYLDLSPEQRAKAVHAAQGRIKALLADPFLTPEQAAHLKAEQKRLVKWERGTL